MHKTQGNVGGIKNCLEMRESMIKVGIIGATGYAGQELVRLLLQHKEVMSMKNSAPYLAMFLKL